MNHSESTNSANTVTAKLTTAETGSITYVARLYRIAEDESIEYFGETIYSKPVQGTRDR